MVASHVKAKPLTSSNCASTHTHPSWPGHLVLQFRLPVCVVFSAVALGVGGVIASSRSESATSELRGACVPLRDSSQAWDCTIVPDNDLRNLKCQSGQLAGLDAIWQIAGSEQEAMTILRWKYDIDRDLRKFADWLLCQQFHVYIHEMNSKDHPRDGSMWISASYRIDRILPFPVPWLAMIKPWSGLFDIKVDKFGQIEQMKHSYTTK